MQSYIFSIKSRKVQENDKIDKLCLFNRACALPGKVPQLGSTFNSSVPVKTMPPKSKTQMDGEKEKEKFICTFHWGPDSQTNDRVSFKRSSFGSSKVGLSSRVPCKVEILLLLS